MAKNCYIDWLRRNNAQMEDIESFQFEDSVNIEQQVSQKMEYEQVMEALQSLPPEQAEAIRLKYLEDMTLAEIAERFNVQPKTIKSRIHDGTMKLRKKLHHTGKEE
ncbi:RNA polymerase sigma factor [Lactimicrobium sp.]|uniref:RNA polymerase sigma factor n=1 Tax=Lactimicrobium sp. TaxID=2563780 RepID=UPI002F35D182